MTDWLNAPVDGVVFTLLFGLRTAACLVFGLHALIVARITREPGQHWWQSFPAWLGLMLIFGDAVTTGTFAVFFMLGAAQLTGVGLLLYLPGTVLTIGAFIVWSVVMGRSA